ncbi:hypothetical protein [Ovoidimarina sediminis]|uniref:hypothetical protein n=1 Tax=Ovoidimarina sediminis TaxID=3079856 RepID=UPI002908EEBB|nr:hypothetical protein [Rhodophyticola sp. MJ-SS7]MDU8946761.1 hypothetical protein [Rhodophyticola sp. MJ-SS7]
MNSEGGPGSLDELLKTLDFLHTPSFLLSVDTSGTFRFSGLNKELESRTGLQSADLAGLTPHEALPPRMADTVEANYARCRDTCEAYSYEELLDLPYGQTW